MPLVLDIEYLLGTAFAAQEEAGETPDWPPQPDRVFSALVASWAARGARAEERRVLEWLEAQPCPEIAAAGGHSRTAPIVFVPPNDAESGRVADPLVMPTSRRRQPRRFPAFRPHEPVASLIWRESDADEAALTTLNALAGDTAYVGHSASLTRCRFRADAAPVATTPARRRVYPGRLAELQWRFCDGERPRPGDAMRTSASDADAAPTGVFADRWLVLEHVGGEMPDLRAAPLVAKALRDALMSGYRQTGRGEAIPPEVSGHAAGGAPSPAPHLALAPLAFVGSRYASGIVYGFALIPPRHRPLLAENEFRQALGKVTQWNEQADRRELKLHALSLSFAPAGETARRSLDPFPYTGKSKIWASVTPVVLDRHLKEKDNQAREEEIAGLIGQACINIQLPQPCRVAVGKHSTWEGAPSAYPSGRAPRWLRWRLPDTLASRQLIHAVVEFPDPVRGPVLLGAGRFVGLGLCRAVAPERG